MTAPGAVVIGTGFGTRVHVPALRAAGSRSKRSSAATRSARRGAPSDWVCRTR